MESLLPEWAPNVHPLIIHFPIALWLVAVFFNLLSLLRPEEWIRHTTMAMYGMGALSAVVAFFSGKQAMDDVYVPFQGEMAASSHSDWGHYTLYFFIGYALLHGFVYWKKLDRKKIVAIVMFVLGTMGMGLVANTADMGGKLVYKHGVGVNQ